MLSLTNEKAKKLERSGVAVVGSILVDKINEISAYPASGELTIILSSVFPVKLVCMISSQKTEFSLRKSV